MAHVEGNERPRVFVVGLDGAEAELVERWIAAGELPALARLRRTGCAGRLTSVADCFAASVWPCLYYGTNPARHNVFSSFPLVPESGRVATLRATRNPDRPFMTYAPPGAIRSIVVDMPKSVPDPALDGLQIVSWGAHAPEHPPASCPAGLLAEVRRRIGDYPLKLLEEDDTAQDDGYYTRLRRGLLAGVDRRKALISHLLDREPDWDIFLSDWAEPHSVGHRFWHFMDPTHPWHRPEAPRELRTAIRDVYAAVDAAIAELLAKLPPQTVVLVVSVHGMMPNHNAQELVCNLLQRWFAPATEGRRAAGATARLARLARQLTPQPVRDTVKQWLPDNIRYGFRMQVMNAVYGTRLWPQMKAFCLPTDDCGYVRINLKGRDRPGLVAPGAEYDALLDEIERELTALRNVDGNEPVIARITRPQELYDGPFRALLPDLCLYWNTTRPVRAARSPRFGEIVDPRRLPQHRSGMHSANAFSIGAGPGLRRGAEVPDGHILDIAPTVLAILGQSKPPHLDGKVLPGVFEPPPRAHVA